MFRYRTSTSSFRDAAFATPQADYQPARAPRLVRVPSLSYGERSAGNFVVHGDNILALQALALQYAGRVRCIYIDPPYNNHSDCRPVQLLVRWESAAIGKPAQQQQVAEYGEP